MIPGYPYSDPLGGLIGGALIGLAAAIILLGLGRIAGISGITASAAGLSSAGMERGQAWAFVIGLPLGALLASAFLGPQSAQFAGPIPLILAGLVVGFGTRIGSGCTSGHGVCGVSRFSQRSLVATLTFMATGIATVALMNAVGLEVLP